MIRLLIGLFGVDTTTASPGYGCSQQATRRKAVASFLGLGLASGIARAVAAPADERPQEGDQLVSIDGAGPTALSPGDVSASPMLVWPMEPASNVVRSGSRLNKIVLVRLEPATLKGPTQARSADGVVAYSAICPHAGCEVNGWLADQQILECPCHNSRYDPSDAAAILEGPTTRALAALPLKIIDGKLAVAGAFAGRVGIAPT